MSTLLERARNLIATKPAALGALAIIPLAAAAQSAQATVAPYSYTSGSAHLIGPSGGFSIASVGFQYNFPGPVIALYSEPFQVLSTEMTGITGVLVEWSGTLNPAFFPPNASNVTIHYDFNAYVDGPSGGNASWTLHNVIGGLTPTDVTGFAGFDPASGAFSGDITIPVTSTLASTWYSSLQILWSGYSTSTPSALHVDIPAGTSVDLGVAAVPEPASLSLLALSTVALLARRRRT